VTAMIVQNGDAHVEAINKEFLQQIRELRITSRAKKRMP